MKILFSAAITLMNQLHYRKKFILLGGISFMAIGVLIYSLFLGLNQVVNNSELQLKGLRFIPPLSSMIQSIQQHRGLSAGWLAGNNDMLNIRVKKENEVARNIDYAEAYFSADLVDNQHWKMIKENWQNIIDYGLSRSISENFAEHTLLIAQLQSFKVFIADEYALTYASEIDTNYLIDTSINKFPEAMEQLAQIRAFGTSILAKKQVSDSQRIKMVTLISRLEASLNRLTINLNKTAYFNPSINYQLFVASTDITESSQLIITLVESNILQGKFSVSPKDFFLQVTSAIDNSYSQMFETLLPTTILLIDNRLSQAKYRLYISISISMVLMLIVLYFFIGIYYSMMDNVQTLTHSLHQFSEGEFAERINLDTQDELKYIGNSFNQLAEKITFLLENVENSKKQMQQILDGLLTMAGILLPDGTLDFANSTPLRLSGLKQQDVIGKKLWDCPWFAYNSISQQQIRSDCQLAAQGEAVDREIEFALMNEKIWVDFSVHPVFDNQNRVQFLVAEARDATRRRLAEEHSKRSQKMDALGKLVGGIAHDYNNMLGVILGYAELLELKCCTCSDAQGYIDEIIRAGERGRSLTRKMLAFSKSESSNASRCLINRSLSGLKDMLSKSLTASVNLEYQLYKKAWPIWIDVNELEDAILNMCINAKYAMPEGGELKISTNNVYLAQTEAKLLGLTANDYLTLSITDTGCGMDKKTRDHVFDPFFTTKGDAGSGLGLSQVFGFMDRSGGAIKLHSQVNEGSEFILYFPRYHQDHYTNKSFEKGSSPQLTGDESILVVDDEPALRELANQILTHFGYRVYTASSGEAALNILAAQTINLMFSDVIMPNMDGYELSRRVAEEYPEVKIQLASGFSDNRHSDTLSDQNLKDNLLDKPYSSVELLTSIRFILDRHKNKQGTING